MSEERIKLIRIEFSDGLDAAKKLKDIVLGECDHEIQTMRWGES